MKLIDSLAAAPRRFLGLLLALVLGLGAVDALAYAGAGAMHAKYTELQERLHNNVFHRPLYIDSAQAGDNLRGDVYAVLDHPFGEVSNALKKPGDWCDVMILPFNTKYCRAAAGGNGAATLQMRIGRKADQPVRDAYPLDFSWRPIAASAEYFETRLDAGEGPFGTRDYRIVLSAVPVDGRRTFVHLSYSYGYGLAGKMAMNAYLATAGARKVGFTVTGREGNGEPAYIGGVRGAIERNAMRYYLAIDAKLAAMRAPLAEQLEKRLEAWFDASERYSRQLHEMDRASYLAMKRGESERHASLQ
ncbi:MAG: hypothetical protein ACXWJM_04805 [Ramlibacter sp.]